jgi:tetratricopeptide (TPR) repeat protein
MNKLTQRDSMLWGVRSNSTKNVGNLAAYEECLAIRRRLAKVDPRNTQWQHDEACILDQIGNEYRNVGMKRRAIEAYEASLVVLRHLAEIDPRNSQRQLDVAISLNKLGDMKFDGADSFGAITSYEESVAIWRRLLKSDPNNARLQFNVAENLEKIGDIKFAAGDNKGTLTSYEEMLSIDRGLVDADSSNAEWQWNLSLSLERIGDVRLASGDDISALAAYEESLALRRRLIELDGSNTQWPEELSFIIKKINDLKRVNEERCAATDRKLAEVDQTDSGVQEKLPLSPSKPGLSEAAVGTLLPCEESVAPRKTNYQFELSAVRERLLERAKLLLLAFVALITAIRLGRVRNRKQALALLGRLTKRARASLSHSRQSMRLTLKGLFLTPSTSRNGESGYIPKETEFIESHPGRSPIPHEGSTVISASVGDSIEEAPNTTGPATMVASNSVSKTDPTASHRSSMKRSRRGRRGKRKRHGAVQDFSASKKSV